MNEWALFIRVNRGKDVIDLSRVIAVVTSAVPGYGAEIFLDGPFTLDVVETPEEFFAIAAASVEEAEAAVPRRQ